ncbi:MAG TPA: primosomal protein N' [Blastocatellia bacterium]|nr:primosomal protein N' [Blastocatellia bacterium]
MHRMYAEVAVPVHVRQTYSYNLPGDMGSRARPGCRVMVPFGKKLHTGFIVALHENLDGEVPFDSIKDVEELIDESPLIPEDILELTRWIADYYYAPWGECLRAALPGGSLVMTEKIVSITEAGRAALNQPSRTRNPSMQIQALDLISRSGPLSMREIVRDLSKGGKKPASIEALTHRLDRMGLVHVTERIGESRLRPKLQNAVRLLAPESPDSGGLAIRHGDVDHGPNDQGDGAGSPVSGAASDTGDERRVKTRRRRGDRALGKDQGLTEQQQRVIDFLKSKGEPVTLSELVEAAGVGVSPVRTLEKRRLLEIFPREVRRDPLAHIAMTQAGESVELTADQQAALDRICVSIAARKYGTILLHGVTGSGKTEVYVRAIVETLRGGRAALMLVPEIALTPVFSRRLRSHFGEALAILHSSLSEGERMDEWRRIKDGDAQVIIGTRSAVFAPVKNLGLVIVDEEHETSYKQEDSPRYHGRDSAVVRALAADATVILGSATPSIESFHNAHAGKYEYIHLGARYGDRPMAQVETVDMREVFKRHGKRQVFSDELLAAIAEAHSRRGQIMILLNRRGFSSFLVCRSCGLSLHCPNCDVTLTYHQYNLSLQCHYCNYVRPVPKTCPTCEGQYIHYVGEGTEQIEAQLQRMYPTIKVGRLDRDTTRRRGSYEHILMEFAAGDIDLLVGTQMIAKGHDYPNVTLVGVISVDAGLAMPDFRSAERTFQLLTQVAGRAGRGDLPGRVVIQTYHPEHYSVVSARAQDYGAFYQREIGFRQLMSYPPFSALVNILVHDRDYNKANDLSTLFANELRKASVETLLRVLGPAPAPLARLRNEYRFQILIKARNRRTAREALDCAMDGITAAGHNSHSITVEVDPVNLL